MDINKRPGSRLSGTATTESGKTYNIYSKPKSPTRPVASPAKPASPMPEGTPRGIVERQKWERFQFKKHGNPYVPRKQIYSEIDRITNENQEALFAHVFGNQYRYEDRNALDPQAQAAYRSALLKFRKNVQDAIMADIKEKQAKHQERMELFDKYYGKDKPKEAALVPVPGEDGPVYGEKVAGEPVYEKGGKGAVTPSETRALAKDLKNSEGIILANPKEAAAQPEVDFFNRFSTKPYMYIWKETEEPGAIYGTNKKTAWTKIELPKYKGKQVTAADVYMTAREENMTVDEVLIKLGAK